MDLQLIDFKQICRVCLQSEMLISLYSAIPYSQFLRPIDMIMKLDLFKIEIDENMPSSICQSCVYRLMDAFTLKQQCEATETHLKEYLNIGNTNASQFSYLGTKNYIFSEFPETRFEDENFSKGNYQTSLQTNLPSTSAQISPPIFNTLNCDIFETNNSEDIEVADDVLNEVDESFVDVVGESLVFKINDIKEQIFFEPPSRNQNENDQLIFKNDNQCTEMQKPQIKQIEKNPQEETASNDVSKPFKCLECMKIFKTKILLEIHMRIHKDIKPYTCEVCNKSFRQIGNFNLHRRMHSNDRRFQCEICSRLFSTSSNLKTHMRSHSDERNFKCITCEKSFKAKIELDRHEKTHKPTKNFFCNQCDRSFLNKAYLKLHIETIHEQKRKYSCSECNKKFASSSNLIVHKRIHNGQKPFQCKICNAKFNQSQALVRHEKFHNNNKSNNSNISVNKPQPNLGESDENNIVDIEKTQSAITALQNSGEQEIASYHKETFNFNISDLLSNDVTTQEPNISPQPKHISYFNNNDIVLSHNTPIGQTGYISNEIQSAGSELNLVSNYSHYHHHATTVYHTMQRPLMASAESHSHHSQLQTYHQANYDCIAYKNIHRTFE